MARKRDLVGARCAAMTALPLDASGHGWGKLGVRCRGARLGSVATRGGGATEVEEGAKVPALSSRQLTGVANTCIGLLGARSKHRDPGWGR